MIGLVKSTFFREDDPVDGGIMPKVSLHLLAGEEIFLTFKSCDIAALFTNKRILFTYTANNPAGEKIFELEFLPYKSIQRFSYLSDSKLGNHILELVVPEAGTLSFLFGSSTQATLFSRIIGEYIL